MEPRINLYHHTNAIKPLLGIGAYLAKSPLEKTLLDLVYFRVSQINGCAYCLDMHSKDLRTLGESEQRLYMLSAWRETSLYTDRERAALAWAEAVTRVTEGYISDAVYEHAQNQFSDTELIDLTMGVISINSFNRMNIAFRTPSGDYQPGQHTDLIK